MSGKEKQQKIKNPEAALQASVARDIKLRIMDDAVRQQKLHLSYAHWNNCLGEKDRRAANARDSEQFKIDSGLTNENVKRTRKAKLEQLYLMEEIMYEEELAFKGLAFRRIRA